MRTWLYLVTSPRAGFSHIRSVYENNQVRLADGLGEFRCELMHSQNVRCFARNSGGKTRRYFPTNAVVTPQAGSHIR